MPKKPMTLEEVNAYREKILMHALEIIREEGFEGFSMRKLARRLGVKAVTIYSYYENKDEIYLAVLTTGFQMLYEDCLRAYNSESEPLKRVQAIMRAYLRFGLENPNFYNLMFTWHVPKYRDYIGTPMEATAHHELVESQKVYTFMIGSVRELAETVRPPTGDEIQRYIIYFWSTIHGYIAGINNELLNYLYEDPLDLREMMLDNLFKYINWEIMEQSGEAKEREK